MARDRCQDLPCVVQLSQPGTYDVFVVSEHFWNQRSVTFEPGQALEVTVDLRFARAK